jgi:hypothetical protein
MQKKKMPLLIPVFRFLPITRMKEKRKRSVITSTGRAGKSAF